ncbi:hypothetical protein X285_00790 [Oenococcus oeni IOEB_9304]|nr:hypothetical protein X285_00790 [Oenococcus oeni IOEB_9304]
MNKRRVLIEHLSVVYLRYKYKKTSVTRPPRFTTASLAIFDEKHIFLKESDLFSLKKLFV